jgi:hypothetical protein
MNKIIHITLPFIEGDESAIVAIIDGKYMSRITGEGYAKPESLFEEVSKRILLKNNPRDYELMAQGVHLLTLTYKQLMNINNGVVLTDIINSESMEGMTGLTYNTDRIREDIQSLLALRHFAYATTLLKSEEVSVKLKEELIITYDDSRLVGLQKENICSLLVAEERMFRQGSMPMSVQRH